MDPHRSPPRSLSANRKPHARGPAEYSDTLLARSFLTGVCFLSALEWGHEEEDPMPDIHWLKDIDAALQEAKAARKPVLVDFSAAPT